MDVLSKIGIDYKIIIAQIINFSLLLFFVKKYLYKPIIDEIESGEKELTSSKEAMQALEMERQKVIEENKKIIAEAHEKSKKTIADAEELAELIKKDATKEAQDKVTKMVEHYSSLINSIEK